MNQFANPAALGGLIMCVAIAAWAIGRWQVLVTTPCGNAPLTGQTQADRSNPADKVAPPLPWPDEAREEPPLALEGAVSLGELHEEITAYRHRERVLSAVPPELLRFDRPPQWHDQACRHVGLTGLLACTEPGACHAQCGAVRTDDPARLRISAGQPASEASPFTRV